jgi:two-component system LytT family response regulator
MRCVIIDDEFLARELIESHAANVPGLEVAGKFANPIEALPFLQKETVDILFLDINMPQISGMDFIRILSPRPKVILTTAYQEFALEAYSLDVVDYLLKPISFPRFVQALAKLSALGTNLPNESIKNEEASKKHIWVRSQQKTVKILLDELIMVEGQKEYLAFYTTRDRIVSLGSFKQLEDDLPDHDFVRVHKSYLISMRHIRTIEGNELTMEGGFKVPVGGTYRDLFIQKLEIN